MLLQYRIMTQGAPTRDCKHTAPHHENTSGQNTTINSSCKAFLILTDKLTEVNTKMLINKSIYSELRLHIHVFNSFYPEKHKVSF